MLAPGSLGLNASRCFDRHLGLGFPPRMDDLVAKQGELILIRAAYGAYPVFGKVFPRCPGRHLEFGIALGRIVNITTNIAYIAGHCILLLHLSYH